MQVEQALGELGHLADAAGDGDARHGVRAQIFEHAADEIAHVDQRDLGQAVQLLHRGLGGRAGRAGDVGEARGARDIDAAMDRMDPGRAGIGHDDAGGAEDRQAADDAEPPVEGLGGQRLAAGNGDLDLDVAGIAVGGGDLGDGLAQHLARHRVDGRLARRNGKARPRHRAHALAGTEADAASARAARRTVARISAPWVTSGSSPASLTTPAVAVPSPSDVVASAKAGRCPRGRVTSTGSGNSPVSSAVIGRLGGRRGAGAGGPAIAERAVVGCHAPRYSAPEARSSRQENARP